MNQASIYDVARVLLVFVGAGGIGWSIVTMQPVSTVGAILAGVASLMAYLTAEQTKAGQAAVAEKVDQVHAATNGMKDALVEATSRAAFAEGKAEGEKGPGKSGA